MLILFATLFLKLWKVVFLTIFGVDYILEHHLLLLRFQVERNIKMHKRIGTKLWDVFSLQFVYLDIDFSTLRLHLSLSREDNLFKQV